MKILIVNHNGGSLYHGPNLRTYYAAKELVALGHEVSMASASYSHKYSNLPETSGVITEEIIDGIQYRWVRCLKYSNLVQRIFSHFLFGFRCIRYLDRICKHADIVIFSGPPPEIFLFAKLIGNKLNARVVADVRDIWPRTQVEMSRWHLLNPYTHFLYFCQYILVRYSDGLVSPLPGVDIYHKSVGARQNTVVIENGFDTSRSPSKHSLSLEIAGCSVKHPFKEGDSVPLHLIKNNSRLIVGYAGAFDRDNDIDAFLAAADRFKLNNDIMFVMVGAGIRLQQVVATARSLDNLVVCNRVASTYVPSVLMEMDILYCGLKPKRIYQYGVSLAKSYEYMAASKPVIWMVEACNNPIEKSGGGWTVKPGDVGALQLVIEQAAKLSTEELELIGIKARQYLEENHSYRVLGKLWEKFLISVLQKSRT
jgi:glycosyltransferase involved in cell wall biosynthesis